MVKQATHNRLSGGSIPSWPTTSLNSFINEVGNGTMENKNKKFRLVDFRPIKMNGLVISTSMLSKNETETSIMVSVFDPYDCTNEIRFFQKEKDAVEFIEMILSAA